MKVLIFSETRIWGGLEVHAVALASALGERGDDATIACLGQETLELYQRHAPEETRLRLVPLPARRHPLGWWRALRDLDADAAVLEKGTLATGSLALDLALRLRFRRYVAVMQLEPPPLPERTSTRHLGGLVPGLGIWWYRWKLQGFARSLAPTMTVCVSDSVRRRLMSDYGFSSRKLMTIHNGVSPARFAPQPATRRAARMVWGVPDEAFVFGSVGRLSDQKALDVAVAAFAKVVALRREMPLYLVCVGEGPEKDRILELSHELGVADRVRLPGFSRSPVEAFQGLDVFLIPSRHEGLPFALVEALASGCLVIGSTVGGIPEVIIDSTLGRLVPPEDPDALAREMLHVLALPAEEKMARVRAGRERVATAFDIRAQCLEFVPLLDVHAASGVPAGDRAIRARP